MIVQRESSDAARGALSRSWPAITQALAGRSAQVIGAALVALAAVKLLYWEEFLDSLVEIPRSLHETIALILIATEFAIGSVALFSRSSRLKHGALLCWAMMTLGGRLAIGLSDSCRCLGVVLPAMYSLVFLVLVAAVGKAGILAAQMSLPRRVRLVLLCCAGFPLAWFGASAVVSAGDWSLRGHMLREPGDYEITLFPPTTKDGGIRAATSTCDCLSIVGYEQSTIVVRVVHSIPEYVLPYLKLEFGDAGGRVWSLNLPVPLESHPD